MEEAPFPVADEHDPEDHGRKRYWVPLEQSSGASSLPVPGWLWHIVFLFLISAFVAMVLVTSHVRNHPPSTLFRASRPERRIRSVRETKQAGVSASKTDSDRERKENHEAMKTEKATAERSREQAKPEADRVRTTPKAPPAPKLSRKPADQKEPPLQKVDRAGILEMIRQDPGRIYLDNQLALGELTFSLRNLSPTYGLELYVENSEDTRKTYYFPKVLIGKQEAVFEGTVLAPGGSLYGYADVPGLRNGMSVWIEISAVGAGSRKEKVKLKW